MFRLSVGLLLYINGSRHFFSVNLPPIFYCDIFVYTVYALVDSVIFLLFEPR